MCERKILVVPYRKVSFATGEIYHVYNRGVEQRSVSRDKKDFKRFLDIANYYSRERSIRYSLSSYAESNKKPQRLIEIICYSLMPNHFHLLVKQCKDGGISKFLRIVLNSYTKYFNTKNKRTGHLFQGTFKAVHVSTDEQLLHVSRYVHLNPLVAGIVNVPKSYEWSSHKQYLEKSEQISSKVVLSFFKNPRDYEKFVNDHTDYAKSLEKIKHEAIDL